MSSKRHKLLPPLIIALCACAAYLLYLNRPVPVANEIEITPLLIDVATVQKQSTAITVSAQGNVQPRTQTQLISQVAGEVIEASKKFVTGGFFHKGEVLLRIKDNHYRSALLEAKAQLASAESALAIERGQAEIALREWNNTAKRSTSSAAKALFLREPQLEEAKARLNSAKAQLQRAEDDLKDTTIVAPYSGMIKAKHADIGQYLSTGAPVADIFAVDVAEVRLAIPSDRLHYLRLPDTGANKSDFIPPSVSLSATIGENTYQWQAKLVRSEGALDERSRVLYVVAQVEDPYGLAHKREQVLRIGTFVDAEIEGKVIDDLVALPRYLLRTGNNIWVVENNRLRNRQVDILRTSSNIIYVKQGLNTGEKISLASVPFALPGTLITENSTTNTQALMANLEANQDYKTMGEMLFTKLKQLDTNNKSTEATQ